MGILPVLLFGQNPKKVPSAHPGEQAGGKDEGSAGSRAERHISLTARCGLEPRLMNPARSGLPLCDQVRH